MTVTPVVEPESLGIDTQRLEELRTRVRREVDGGVLPSCQFALTCGGVRPLRRPGAVRRRVPVLEEALRLSPCE